MLNFFIKKDTKEYCFYESYKPGSSIYEIDLGEDISKENARKEVEEMCKRLLANPVIQTYEIDIK